MRRVACGIARAVSGALVLPGSSGCPLRGRHRHIHRHRHRHTDTDTDIDTQTQTHT